MATVSLKDRTDAYAAGATAYNQGARLTSNPHTENNLNRAWMMGWQHRDSQVNAQREKAAGGGETR